MKKLLIAILILSAGSIHSQNVGDKSTKERIAQGVQSITLRSCEAQLNFLASDLLQGRGAGTAQNHIASEYIYSELWELGYEPYYQEFRGKYGENLRNVLVTIPGRDTTSYTIVGAHLDHLGVRYGQIYNGADDNASGTVAVLQIARALRTAGLTPGRSMILAFWDGEETGLQGSAHFAKAFGKSEKIANYMNFDMIGRNSDEANPQSFTYFYTSTHRSFEEWLRSAISEYGLQLRPDYNAWDDPRSGSDNATFARLGVPICWFHTQGHPDYHRPGDVASKLNWDKMLQIIKASYVVAWNMAQ